MKINRKKLRLYGLALPAFLMVSACSLTHKKLDETLAAVRVVEASAEHTQTAVDEHQISLEKFAEQQQQIVQQLEQVQQSLTVLEDNKKPPGQIEKKASTSQASPRQYLANTDEGKLTLGRIEWLWVPEIDRYFAVLLDTALDLSVLYADNIQPFERDGKKWLRFDIERNGWRSSIDTPVLRQDKITYLGNVRPVRGTVVSLPVQLASFSDAIEFIVVEKKKSYPQIIMGKNFLTDVAKVDVSLKYTMKKAPSFVQLERAAENTFRKQQADSVDSSENDAQAAP